MAEQGYVTVEEGVAVNDKIRQINNQGWQVKQVVSTVMPSGNVKYGLLLER